MKGIWHDEDFEITQGNGARAKCIGKKIDAPVGPQPDTV